MSDYFRCGHPRIPENFAPNSGRVVCLSCKREHAAVWWRKQDEKRRRQMYRRRFLPHQLEAARRKVAALENEARELGFTHLVQP